MNIEQTSTTSSNFAAAQPMIVLVPIYKPALNELEQFSIDYSLETLAGREVRFLAPLSLDMSAHLAHHPDIPVDRFDDQCFASVRDYSRLLLSQAFYERYLAYEHMLILQTDAILLRDDLDDWCEEPYDYIGAPWPNGLELEVAVDRFRGTPGQRIFTKVGNGGLSLRRSARCIELLREFPDVLWFFTETGSSEDLFFATMGQVSQNFRLPSEDVAARFALELKPDEYLEANGMLPMGGHAWWRYNMPFWASHLRHAPPVMLPKAPPRQVDIGGLPRHLGRLEF
jgi:Protein of unknown function (DUF5672)